MDADGSCTAHSSSWLLGLYLLLACAVLGSGCATMESQYHTFEVRGTGELVRDISYQYGTIESGKRPALSKGGGDGVSQAMPIPETLTIRWTTTDGRQHEVTTPVRAKVPSDIRGKRVSAQIDGPSLRVLLLSGTGLTGSVVTQIYP